LLLDVANIEGFPLIYFAILIINDETRHFLCVIPLLVSKFVHTLVYRTIRLRKGGPRPLLFRLELGYYICKAIFFKSKNNG
jgi:hypothetical protein